MLTRVMFLQVCLLEPQDRVLCMVGILRGGFLKTFLNSLSCSIFRFLLDDPIIRTGTLAKTRVLGLPSTLRGV
ncbi:hypothetical protein EDB92DRAFT_1880052 [Lactarius akahatsu]|uniref:Uncharacterized protein n=1 Tax=Lactarius akahatsu TaxID=416441 RepID=A0AAD4LC76_9AGAM|nr:hypothetical protein EDB92DRAFT_1880052 [Lactarius akahatsu]